MYDRYYLSLLALDPATHTGWSHSKGIAGVWDLSIKRNESAGMRLIRLKAKLKEIHKLYPIDLLVFETPVCYPKRIAAFSVQIEIQAVIKIFCEENGIDYKGYSPTEIKKHATGKGKASKENMVDAAEIRFQCMLQDDQHDQADAMWLLDLAQKDLGLDQIVKYS